MLSEEDLKNTLIENKEIEPLLQNKVRSMFSLQSKLNSLINP